MVEKEFAQVERVYQALVPVYGFPRKEFLHRKNVTSLHKDVMGLFSADLPGEEGVKRSVANILFRLDFLDSGVKVFVQSTQPFVTDNPNVVMRECGVESFVFPVGSKVRFRLAVNAITRQAASEVGGLKVRGTKAVPVLEENFLGWLQDKLGGGLVDLSVLSSVWDCYRLLNGAAVWVNYVDGVGVVSDSLVLRNMLLGGVGRAKSYGCGLLSAALLG